ERPPVQLVRGQVRVLGEQLGARPAGERGELQLRPRVVPGVEGADPEAGLVPEVVLVLGGEPQLGQVGPQPVDALLEDAGLDQVRLDDLLVVQVVGDRAVGADREPVMAYGSRDLVHPAGRAAGDEDERGTGLLDAGEGGGRPGGDGAVRGQSRPVEVGGDGAGEGHGRYQCAPPRPYPGLTGSPPGDSAPGGTSRAGSVF